MIEGKYGVVFGEECEEVELTRLVLKGCVMKGMIVEKGGTLEEE
jgi:hypothetical protein